MDAHDKIIKDAQYRKGLSIAFFNATNAAVEMAKRVPVGTPDEYVVDLIRKYRDTLLQEHAEYYARVIAQVGATYDTQGAIERIENCNTLEELKKVWILLSADEREDAIIIGAKDNRKKELTEGVTPKPKKANEKAH